MKRIFELILKLITKIELMKYDEYTIENYFRKKGFKVGNNNRIYLRALAGESSLIKIGNNCTITTGVYLLTHDGGAWVFREENPDLNVFGKIEIKDNCFLGVNSIILPNVTIGPNSVVGAGSVVAKDVPENTVVAGVPARVICSLEEYKDKCTKEWKALNLTGPRQGWEKQLVNYFWPENGV